MCANSNIAIHMGLRKIDGDFLKIFNDICICRQFANK